MARDYVQEGKWESSPEQKKRRAARGRARYAAEKAGKVHKGDSKEVDHDGFHPHGSLAGVSTTVRTRTANRKRQPPHKAAGNARDKYGK